MKLEALGWILVIERAATQVVSFLYKKLEAE